MAQPWFRLYTEVLTDRKIGKICERVSLPKSAVIGTWVTVLCLANDSPERGSLLLAKDCPVSDDDLIGYTGLDRDMLEAILEQLKALCMIVQEGGVYHVTNWDKRQRQCFGRNRTSHEYIKWRLAVFERDEYICQHCKQRGGKLNAHHVKQWADDEYNRHLVENGITLCLACHKNEHKRLRQCRHTLG